MSNFIYSLILTSIAGLSTMIGSIFIYLKIDKNNINKFISFCLSFTIVIMIGISITDLIPESFKYLLNIHIDLYLLLIIIFLLFILSYLIIKYIFKKINSNNHLYKIGIGTMITLIIHNIPEGMLTFLSSYTSFSLGIKYVIAIALHNIPEGICISVPIYYASKSKKKALLKTFYSGISEIIGGLLSYLFLAKYLNNFLISMILLIVSFLMIILSIEEIYPKVLSYKEDKSTLKGFILGIIVIIINFLISKYL